MWRAATLLLALALGIFNPIFAVWSPLIRWILVFMLWTGFLGMPLSTLAPRRSHLRLLAAWSVFPALGWLLLRPLGPEAAVAGFLVGATPTATAAPTITRLLGGDAGYVSVSFLGSNLLAMVLIPSALVLMGSPLPHGLFRFFVENIAVVAGPLVLAAMAHRIGLAERLSPLLSKGVFPLWLVALVLASAKTSAFLRQSAQPWGVVLGIAFVSGLLCAGQFLVGRRMGGTEHALEAAQSLGQKNTMLTLWLGLATFGPLAALGPATYVLWHNLWNAIQMARTKRFVRN
ncbi:MAG: hypothetical protein IPN71_17800 [Fibrobacteres bacterium]|nr:hypothetical protein [Fibrobacterota bacterium]